MNLDAQYYRDYLRAVAARVSDLATALEWLEGQPTLIHTELAPPFDAGSEGERAWQRYAKRVQSIGPRALRLKRSGTVGSINWGGDSKALDKQLELLDLSRLARESFKALMAGGATAAWAYKEKGSGRVKLQRLGGYGEPLYPEGDAGGEIVGWYQVQASGDGRVRYTVRVYDFEMRELRIWRGRQSPTEIHTPPQETIPNAPMPRVAVFDVDQAGLPLGEFATALPIVKQEVAEQVQQLRNADAHVHAILALYGRFEEIKKLGPNTIIKGNEQAKAERIAGADFEQLFVMQDRTLERLRTDLALPAGFLGGDVPSGEAFREWNAPFISSCQEYASILSQHLTGLVEDYAKLLGIEPAPVTVSINREAMRQIISEQVRGDYKEGIIDLRAATTAISVYYPDWDVAAVEAFISREEGTGMPQEPGDFADAAD